MTDGPDEVVVEMPPAIDVVEIEMPSAIEVVEIETEGPQGPEGKPGPPGSGGGAVVVIHTQSAPSASWVIPHSLGRLPASVTVYDAAGAEWIAEVYATSTVASVVFANPLTGTAILT